MFKNEPRFILIAANVKTAKSETFDSYDQNNITINHVIASAAIPINYPYVEIGGNKYWDGGILSNTPLRELINSHITFWTKKFQSSYLYSKNNLTFDNWDTYYKKQKENNIPNLSLTIVNLHPGEEEDDHMLSLYDYDMTKDREKVIRFHDKTDYDIKLAQYISDYHDYVELMTQLNSDAIKEIKDKDDKIVKDLKERFTRIINTEQRTRTRDDQPIYFYDLIGKKFDIIDVSKIQRNDDEHTISDKVFGFSSITISNLLKEGEKDAFNEIIEKTWENEGKKSAINKLKTFIDDIENEKIIIESEENLYILELTKEKLVELEKSNS